MPLTVPQQTSPLEQVAAPQAITVDPDGHELWSAAHAKSKPPSAAESLVMQHVDVVPEHVRDPPHIRPPLPELPVLVPVAPVPVPVAPVEPVPPVAPVVVPDVPLVPDVPEEPLGPPLLLEPHATPTTRPASPTTVNP